MAAKELFIEDELFLEIVAPTRIQPLNIWPLRESVMKSKRLLIVEEGPNFASLGAELVAALAEAKTPIQELRRIGNNSLIPSSHMAEKALLPSVVTIKQMIKEML